jgi:hypothetical protein
MPRTILEQVQTTGFRVTVRDTQTNETRTLRLTGNGPWDLDADADVEINEDTGPRPRIPVAPPPDAAITLRIACTRESTGVRVGAVGSGAIAWTAHQKTLLGAKWQRDERGAPFVLLEKTPTLFADLRAAHPDVTIDNADCQDTNLLYSGRTSPETGARQAVGRAGRRGEKPEAAPPVAEVAAEPLKPPTPPPAPPAAAEPDVPAPPPAKRPRKHDAVAAGPGELEWVPITENTVEGFAAAWRGGAYKLLHLAGDTYALIYEHGFGGFDMILCGDINEARAAAAAHIDAMPVDQVARAACTTKTAKAPCRSPRRTRVHSVEDLLGLYRTRSVEAAFTAAVRDGMSLCADHAGSQDHSDLSVPQALELLRERGADAVYALAELRREGGTGAAPPRPRLSIRYSRAGETTSGPLVNVTLRLHIGDSDPVSYRRDGVQLYNHKSQPKEFLESLFEDVIDQDDAKLLRRLGKFLGRVLPSEKFKPADFELSERNEDHTLAKDLVDALSESVAFDMHGAEEKEAENDPTPAKAPSTTDQALIDSFAAALSNLEDD